MPMPLAEQQENHQTRLQQRLSLPVTGYTRSPLKMAYRSRIHLRRGPDGRLGYHQARSHQSIAITECPIAREEIGAVLTTLGTVPAPIETVELRSDGSRVVASVRSQKGQRAAAREWLESLDVGAWSGVPIALDGKTVRGNPRTTLNVAGITHELGPTTFYQVNLEVNALLVADVNTAIEALEPERVLDLFAGAGNLSLPLAASGIGLTLLEAHPAASKDAMATVARHELDVEVQTRSAETYKAGDAWFDVAIVDPPRAGAKGILDQLLITRPRAVVMVSCNPTTLAQDLRRARGHGYHCESVHLYEMFPHTRHVEAMGVLHRDA